MSHKRAHHLYFSTRIKLIQRKIPLQKRTTHIRPQRQYFFFYNGNCALTIMHTLTSGNTIAIRALRCFSHHYRTSNKLTEGHFLRAHSRGVSLQEIGPVDITATHCGSACSPIRGERRGRERIWEFKGAGLFSRTSRSISSEEYSVSSIYVRGS